MPNSIEAPRESGSPVPAQRAARLPYETEPLQILVDPADPNIDLATQLGLGENTFFSSRLKPGRVIPSYLGISHHVLDYRMDQMAQEQERLAEQPIPPSLLQRAGETLRRVAPPALVPATALGAAGAAVITIVQPNIPSAEASGFVVTGGGFTTTVECVDDVILVYKKPPIIAAVGENTDQELPSAPPSVEPGASVTPDPETADADLPQDVEIALGNGVILVNAKACESKPTPILHTAQELKDAPYPDKPNNPQAIKKQQAELLKKLRADLEKAFEGDPYPEITSVVFPKGYAQKSINTCLKATTATSPVNALRRSSCKDVIYGALDVHLMTRDPKFYQLALDMRDLAVIRFGNIYKNALYADMTNAYPPGWIPDLSDY